MKSVGDVVRNVKRFAEFGLDLSPYIFQVLSPLLGIQLGEFEIQSIVAEHHRHDSQHIVDHFVVRSQLHLVAGDGGAGSH